MPGNRVQASTSTSDCSAHSAATELSFGEDIPLIVFFKRAKAHPDIPRRSKVTRQGFATCQLQCAKVQNQVNL